MPYRTLRHALAAFSTLLAMAGAHAADPPTLAHCAAIGAAPDRLACYDQLAGRAAAPAVAAAQQPLPSSAAASAPAPTSVLAAKDAPLPDAASAKPPSTLFGKFSPTKMCSRQCPSPAFSVSSTLLSLLFNTFKK